MIFVHIPLSASREDEPEEEDCLGKAEENSTNDILGMVFVIGYPREPYAFTLLNFVRLWKFDEIVDWSKVDYDS